MPALNKRILHIEIPARMQALPVSDEGFPIPWFVPMINGKPEFRGMSGEKLSIAVRHEKCWLCGQQMGIHKTFPIGPMCCVTRTISEPPSHRDCAEYGAKACPFLTQPKMRRNEKDMPDHRHVAGIAITRNPGCIALWTTRTFKPFKAPNGGILFSLGDPEHVAFWAEGRRATRKEVVESMESGLPLLMDYAVKEGPEAVQDLLKQFLAAKQYLPEK